MISQLQIGDLYKMLYIKGILGLSVDTVMFHFNYMSVSPCDFHAAGGKS